MDIESALILMEERGYTVMSRSGDKTEYHMANMNNELSAVLVKSGDSSQVKLSFSHGLFVTASGFLQVDHPRFVSLFEAPLILIKKTLGDVLSQM